MLLLFVFLFTQSPPAPIYDCCFCCYNCIFISIFFFAFFKFYIARAGVSWGQVRSARAYQQAAANHANAPTASQTYSYVYVCMCVPRSVACGCYFVRKSAPNLMESMGKYALISCYTHTHAHTQIYVCTCVSWHDELNTKVIIKAMQQQQQMTTVNKCSQRWHRLSFGCFPA